MFIFNSRKSDHSRKNLFFYYFFGKCVFQLFLASQMYHCTKQIRLVNTVLLVAVVNFSILEYCTLSRDVVFTRLFFFTASTRHNPEDVRLVKLTAFGWNLERPTRERRKGYGQSVVIDPKSNLTKSREPKSKFPREPHQKTPSGSEFILGWNQRKMRWFSQWTKECLKDA